MNIKTNTRKLVTAGVLTAITFLLGLTPLGYIPLPTMKITILCLPVIIGVLMEGLGVGVWLGFIFGLTSFINIYYPGDPFGLFVLGISVPRTLAMIFIPRLLVPVTAYYTYKAIKLIGNKITDKAGYGVAALVGSLTNTVLFLGMMYVLFIPEMAELASFIGTTKEGMMAVIGSIVVTNGIPEAVAAVIIVSAVSIAVAGYRGTRNKE